MCIWLHYTTYLSACILCACRGAVAALEALLQHYPTGIFYYTTLYMYIITLHYILILCACVLRACQGAVAARSNARMCTTDELL